MIMSSRIKLLLEFRHPVDEHRREMLGFLCQSVFVLLDGHSPLKKLRVKRGVEQIAQVRPEPHQGVTKVLACRSVAASQVFEMSDFIGRFFEERGVVKCGLV